MSATSRRPGHVPAAWWLLALLGWVGGLLAWTTLRDRSPAAARNILLAGVALSVVYLLLYVVAR